MSNITFGDVEKFCRFLISLGGIFDVDDEGYIVNKSDDNDDPVLIKDGNQYKRIMVMKEVMTDTDCIVINPFNENLSESQDSKWLYSNLAVGLTKRIIDIYSLLRNITTATDDTIYPVNVLSFASRHKDIDEKAFEYFGQITSHKKRLEFMNIWFMRKLKESRFRCSLYDEDIRIANPQVSKKAWKSLTAVMNDLLGIPLTASIDEASQLISDTFYYKSNIITVPKLQSILNVYYKVYDKLNSYLELCNMDDEDFVIDLTTFGHHIGHLEDYYEKTKWFTAAIGNVSEPASISKPQVQNIGPNPVLAHQKHYQPQVETGGIPLNPLRPVQHFEQQPMQQPMFGQLYQQPQSIPINNQFGFNQPQPINIGGGFRIPIR
jgi:hypothetical protein